MSITHNVMDLLPQKFIAEPILSSVLIERLCSVEDVEYVDFDQIFPPYYQFQSPVHWSPIRVARQIADWLRPLERKSIVDIGCGVGKLCFLLRILTDYEIVGIEQRPKLVGIANKIIERNDFKNISIVQKNMLELDWDLYDVYYLYNPFQEHMVHEGFCSIDHDIEFDRKNFAYYSSEVFRQLTWAKPGKVLITFHGYGAAVPRGWRMFASLRVENGDLTMWIKESL
ncbi:MAG: methyltransferase domain-containing protein [Pseudobdellovibrionaceae bacterium]